MASLQKSNSLENLDPDFAQFSFEYAVLKDHKETFKNAFSDFLEGNAYLLQFFDDLRLVKNLQTNEERFAKLPRKNVSNEMDALGDANYFFNLAWEEVKKQIPPEKLEKITTQLLACTPENTPISVLDEPLEMVTTILTELYSKFQQTEAFRDLAVDIHNTASSDSLGTCFSMLKNSHYFFKKQTHILIYLRQQTFLTAATATLITPTLQPYLDCKTMK